MHGHATVTHLTVLHGSGRRLVIKSRGRVLLVNVDEIRWVEASGDYMRIHAATGTHLLRMTMGELEGRLDSSVFVHIHRSTIVGKRYVKELRPLAGGDYRVILLNGVELRLSRSRRSALASLLDGGM